MPLGAAAAIIGVISAGLMVMAPLMSPATLPAGMDEFFLKALEPDPSRRFASGGEFAAAFPKS